MVEFGGLDPVPDEVGAGVAAFGGADVSDIGGAVPVNDWRASFPSGRGIALSRPIRRPPHI